MRVLEKQIHVDQAGTGNDAFVADMSEASEQVAEESDFQFVTWSKVAMPAFAGENVPVLSVPDEASFAQARSCRNYGLIAGGILIAKMVESDGVGRPQTLDSPSLRLEIVDQLDRIELQFPRQARRLDDPGQIGSFDPSIAHRTGDTEAGDGWPLAGFGDELEHNLIQPAKFPAVKDVFVDSGKLVVILPVIAEACVCSADISGENHLSKFLQCRPSRSNISSASLGPQVPAA